MSFLFGSSKTTNSSQSSTPTLTSQGQSLFSQLLNFGTNLTTDPTSGLAPIQQSGEEQINSGYGNIPQVISTSMARRGYGSSGSMGNSLYQTQLARLNSLSNFKGTMANLASQRQLAGGSLMEQLLGTQVGSNSTGKSTTTTSDPFGALMGLGSLLGSFGLFGGGGGGGSPDPISPSDLTSLAGPYAPDAFGG